MNTTDTIALEKSKLYGLSRVLRRRMGVALLGAALVSASACGDTGSGATSVSAPASPTTTMAPPARSTTSTPATTTTATTTTATTTPATTTTTVTTVPAATVPRPTAPLDELAAVDGGRLHVRCAGSGATTVVLIAGFEEGAENWGKVEPAISASARLCTYERHGTGTSDPPTATQTFTTQANELHALLTTVGEPGPYVVVGHSFGGAEAVTFASLFAPEVTGLVLIDASPVTWPAALSAVSDDGTETATMLRSFSAGFAEPTRNAEHLDVLASFAEVSGVASLGSLPMTVITAVDRGFPGLGAGELARLTDVWDQGQQRWSELSTAGRVVSVADTSHHIQLDQPGVVIDEITRLLP